MPENVINFIFVSSLHFPHSLKNPLIQITMVNRSLQWVLQTEMALVILTMLRIVRSFRAFAATTGTRRPSQRQYSRCGYNKLLVSISVYVCLVFNVFFNHASTSVKTVRISHDLVIAKSEYTVFYPTRHNSQCYASIGSMQQISLLTVAA